ncbi:MAG: SAM-dependent methyltransferase [Nitrosomonadaceae bacterium]|nr:SAM-dependent methyltransferase [Nitrosomonadaceae bacterium]|tara:strand:- start:13493 stop:15604 length:2112 start_codon:yes stop_codon:yes gene_type:complete
MANKLFNRTPLLSGENAVEKKEEILSYFHATLDRTESLFETLLSEESYFKKSIPLRHPLIFYLGHTSTFFINKLLISGLIKERLNPKMESMFAVGVDEMSWDDLTLGDYDWPSIKEVYSYRKLMRNTVSQLLTKTELTLPINWDNPWWIVLMGIEHELIHLETSSVLVRQHEIKYVKTHADWEPCRESSNAPLNELINVAAGKVKIGKNEDDLIYGWDNEFGYHEAEIGPFQASKYLVSNQEFLEFINADGYNTDKFWEEEGLAWLEHTGAQNPTFWVKSGAEWKLRLITEEISMPWDWPVETNYHEAKAFCNWKAEATNQPIRLPTEDEWYRLYNIAGLSEVPKNKQAEANIHLDYFASSCPVTKFKHGEFFDIVGNAWQWTETPIYPFEGFKVHPLYDDFTTPTFDGRHNIIKGGSWISCGNESLKSSRYAFRRHFFQHAGFRYVSANTPTIKHGSHYETDKLLTEYAEFHYGDTYFGVPNFPVELAKIAIEAMGNRPAQKALDLGCASGRSTFELAQHFDHVTGIDFSARFIGQGVQLAETGILRYTLQDEGDLISYKESTLISLGLDHVKNKVEFYQGDACNLKPIYAGYDLILASNLIDRLYEPSKLLTAIHERVIKGGLLIIASPYTWLEEHTKKEEWIGGFKQDGENVSTLDGLKKILASHFKLIQGPQAQPFVIRETSRKFQHTLSEVTVWEKID